MLELSACESYSQAKRGHEMSEYTREEILKLIEENGGPEGLDLSGKDLSGVDLSREAIAAELGKARERAPDETPVWYNERTGGINLVGANLQGTKLSNANLQSAYLLCASLQSAHLINANLQGACLKEANLQGAILASANLRAYLEGANLQRAILWDANLQGAYLVDTSLQGAHLREANLQGADLGRANLQGAHLRDANLLGAELEDADLQGAYLWSVNLQGAFLSGANLQGADLMNADLQGANLLGAKLQKAILRGVKLQKVNLTAANLQGADLSYSHLEKVDFFAAESLEGAYFYNAYLDDTRIKREQLGEAIGEELVERYDEAKEAYLALKNNFAEIGRYRDESWAYVKERQMGKMMNHPRLAREYYREELPENPNVWQLGWFYARHTAKWVADWVVEWTCGYGESVLRTLRAMGVALVGFAVLYRLFGAVVDANGNPSSSWLHCLLYSGGAFTTFGVDTLRPANDWVRALSILESVVGIALTGLLGFVLGNRIRRT